MFCALLATSLTQTTVDLPRFPSLSPNGDRICFSWRGDLWSVSSSGGHAQRLTAHSANETRSAWSPDGAEIVFESDRDGVRNLWCMAADGTECPSTHHAGSSGHAQRRRRRTNLVLRLP